MKILAVHSTSPHLGVAVTEEDRVLVERVLPAGKAHLENLAPLIRDLLDDRRQSIEEIDGFGVARGPGSFSGIRVGMATVKGLAIALGKPVAGISSLEILAWQALKAGETGAAVIDARRKSVYAGLYGRDRAGITTVKEPALMRREDFAHFAHRATETPILCSAGDVSHLEEAMPTAVDVRIVTQSPAVCAILACKRLSRGEADNLHSLAPLYLRRSDAEEKRLSAN